MSQHRLAFYQPGHFHAALTLRHANPRVANDIHIYAEGGPERDAFTDTAASARDDGDLVLQRFLFHA